MELLGETYYRSDLETMPTPQLMDLVKRFHDECMTESLVGEHVWIEFVLNTMILQRRVDKLEQLK